MKPVQLLLGKSPAQLLQVNFKIATIVTSNSRRRVHFCRDLSSPDTLNSGDSKTLEARSNLMGFVHWEYQQCVWPKCTHEVGQAVV